MSRWNILLDKTLWKHLGIISGVAILLLLAIFMSLRIYTLHGKSEPLPDLTGLTESQLQEVLQNRHLRYVIIDSVHFAHMPKGVVVEQEPGPGTNVKRNRRIFLTINSWFDEQVAMPNLVDYSIRSAKVILESSGLNLGNLIYVPSEYTNLVLDQQVRGVTIAPGTLINKGSSVNLLVGSGLSSETTFVPNLIGLKLRAAQHVTQGAFLNIRSTIYDSTVISLSDTLNSFVWRQSPTAHPGAVLNLGSSIDVWLTMDETLLMVEEPPIQEQTEEEFSEEFF